MYRSLSVYDSISDKVILFAESKKGVFSHTISGSDAVTVNSSDSSMMVAAVSVDPSVVVRDWKLSGDYTEIEDGLIEFNDSSSTNNYPRYVSNTTSGHITVIDEHGSHAGTPNGVDMSVKSSSYGGCVGVRHTSTDDGYEFLGWEITTSSALAFEAASDGVKRDYTSTDVRFYATEDTGFDINSALVIYNISSTRDITIKALYENVILYTVSFNANGGSGAPEQITAKAGESVAIPDIIPQFGDANFLGWAITRNATSAQFSPGDTIVLIENLTLFAVWEGVEPPPTPDDPSTPGQTKSGFLSFIASSGSITYNKNGSLAFL
jgi:hypothetical protein